MNRDEFLNTLRERLTGELSPSVIADNIHYYDQYIGEQMAQGNTEEQVLAALGDPNLIARTIIDTHSTSQGYEDTRYTAPEEEPGFQKQTDRGMHAYHIKPWMVIAVVVCVIMMILALVFSILRVLLPILLPVILILFLVSLFKKR